MKKQTLTVSLAVFVFSLAIKLLSFMFSRLPISSFSQQDYIVYARIIYPWSNFAINPVMVFVAFYLIGKKINLASELKSVIIALLIGEVAAHFAYLGFVTLWAISQNIGIGIPNDTFTLLSLLPNPLTGEFFVALAALSVAYIRRNKSTHSITSSPTAGF